MENRVVVLDVGHGNCAIVHDRGVVVVVDTGPKSSLLEYLREQKITHLDCVLLSHADQDHIAGLLAIISSGTVTIGRVRLNTDSLKTSKLWDDLVWELDRNSTIDFHPVLTVKDSGAFDTPQISIEIVAPSAYLASKGAGSVDRQGRRLDTNSLSVAIRLVYSSLPIVLFAGDINSIALESIIENKVDISARIAVFPHHGGLWGASRVDDFVNTFINAVDPDLVVFSIGRGMFRTPRPELVEAIRKSKPGVRFLCTQLSMNCAASVPKETTHTHLAPIYSQGKSNNSCCAGSIVYYFESDSFFPNQAHHRDFISKHAESRLCGNGERAKGHT